MTIETQFEPNEKVWIMYDNKPTEFKLSGVEIRAGLVGGGSGGIRIDYHFKKPNHFQTETFTRRKREIFRTKEELLNSL